MAVQRVWGKADLLDRLHREKQKDFSQSFGDAWLFTLLSLHAMAGPEISGAKMELVRNREDLKPEYIWSCIYQESGKPGRAFSPCETVNCSGNL